MLGTPFWPTYPTEWIATHKFWHSDKHISYFSCRLWQVQWGMQEKPGSILFIHQIALAVIIHMHETPTSVCRPLRPLVPFFPPT